MCECMTSQNQSRPTILVLEDVEETRDLMGRMLQGNGYCVSLARSEEDAISKTRIQPPDLILMSLGLEPSQLVATAQRILQETAMGHDITVVIFCIPTIPEGSEVEIAKNIYLIRPDNFDQVRALLDKLLSRRPFI
jgi:CheY-like chemotaxis protein